MKHFSVFHYILQSKSENSMFLSLTSIKKKFMITYGKNIVIFYLTVVLQHCCMHLFSQSILSEIMQETNTYSVNLETLVNL